MSWDDIRFETNTRSNPSFEAQLMKILGVVNRLETLNLEMSNDVDVRP